MPCSVLCGYLTAITVRVGVFVSGVKDPLERLYSKYRLGESRGDSRERRWGGLRPM